VTRVPAIQPTFTTSRPSCGETALYRYGRAPSGKRRFRCLVCGRPFTDGAARPPVAERPRCPACGRAMHVYRRDAESVRFRCAAYPARRTFRKLPNP
jgi:transposase-like protein